MAGYFIYTIDNDVFSKLTTSPTQEQGMVLADYIRENLDGEPGATIWPQDRDALAELIVKRLALPDWYSDLSVDDASIWEDIVFSLQDEPGEAIGLDFQCSDYESIYWDCAEIAAEQGATMMAEPTFGNSGFRYFGKPSRHAPIYSFFPPEQTKELLSQLARVESHFASLTNEEGSPREQFFEGLLPPVKNAVANGRVLWVQTDT